MSTTEVVALYEEVDQRLQTLIRNFPGCDDDKQGPLHQYRKSLIEHSDVIFYRFALRQMVDAASKRLKACPHPASSGREHQIRVQASACFSVALKKIEHRLAMVDQATVDAQVQALPSYGMF